MRPRAGGAWSPSCPLWCRDHHQAWPPFLNYLHWQNPLLSPADCVSGEQRLQMNSHFVLALTAMPYASCTCHTVVGPFDLSLPYCLFGVPAGNVKCEVVGFMRKLMNGGYYPWAPKSGAGYVDIDDVAAAHTLAMLTPKASGRSNCCHLCTSSFFLWSAWDEETALRQQYVLDCGEVLVVVTGTLCQRSQ